jgi:hypothetical protein
MVGVLCKERSGLDAKLAGPRFMRLRGKLYGADRESPTNLLGRYYTSMQACNASCGR